MMKKAEINKKKIIFFVFFMHVIIFSLLFFVKREGKSTFTQKIEENIVYIKKEMKKDPVPPKVVPKRIVKKIAPAKKVIAKTSPQIDPNKIKISKEALKNLNEIKKKLFKDIDNEVIEMNLNAISKLEIPKLSQVKFDVDKDFEINDIRKNLHEKISTFFKDHLHLPEIGEVKLRVKIKKDGSFDILETISKKSEENEAYLISSLKSLVFAYDDKDQASDDIILSVTFTNK